MTIESLLSPFDNTETTTFAMICKPSNTKKAVIASYNFI